MSTNTQIMTLWFCMGTAGELIKIFPLLHRAERLGIPWLGVHTGQSGVNFWKQWDDFQLPREKSVSTYVTNQDLTSSSSAFRWFASSLFLSRKDLQSRLESGSYLVNLKKDFFFVHGDTLSTLLGSIYAKRLGLNVVHIEAGLRSKYLLQPFP